ncbi:vp1054 [Malacosoma neustria nucleopolyhedrovirus]|uniref:vp1054 n=1 Tax=Malacosoma neustria nuclear polyhedrosis virus TaxID=38012 RepID=UPI000E358C99|nr:vp1054 [Malacosoma neustria nucleopolyhedrovirus]AUF81570.1 vp1054 [Malacosoma neustria nucleopolyhedrovirus]
MLSMAAATPTTIKYTQCVSEKLIPFKPLKLRAGQCQIHRSRANCLAMKPCLDDTDNYTACVSHVTVLESVYLDNDLKPYYLCMIDDDDDVGNSDSRKVFLNATQMYAVVNLRPLDENETFYAIDEGAERNMSTLKIAIKTIMDIFQTCQTLYILMADELVVDVVYSVFRTVVLPQRMIYIHQTDNVPLDTSAGLKLFTVPTTPASVESQLIYRTFLMYNTILTMILKQKNPFNANKNISIIFRNLGKCPNNKDRLKCCDLDYGGNAPGHIMCPPREMVKRIFHYAKWVKTPNNYKRYYELILAPTVKQRNFSYVNSALLLQSPADISLYVLDWYNFIQNFRDYFGIGV